ncbi:MAG: hypothetical protein LC685_04450 [Actinobacteria bacterium]|nr:hypothetical protein [Actinomycetota bacterium]
MKKRFRKLKRKLPGPLVLIPIGLLVVVLVGGYFLFFAGDDSSDKTANTAPARSGSGDGSGHEQGKLKQPKAPKAKPEQPTGKEITIDSDRDEKDYAIAQAIGAIKTPARIGLRVGAAPKQPVTVNSSIVCLLATEGSKSNADTFSVTPPISRDLKLPVPDAVSCTASVTAQLTRAGKGRIKVFLTGMRRAGG